MTILNFYQISKLIKNSLQSTLRYTSQLSASALNVTYRTIIIMNYIEMMHMNHLGHYWPKWIILQSWDCLSWNLLCRVFLSSIQLHSHIPRAQPPAFPRQSNGRLGFPGPTEEEAWNPHRNSIHRVAFKEVSGHRVLFKSVPWNWGLSACGTTHEAMQPHGL